ncbi:MAG TPA: dienelactone hydrolase family protein [Acidimicrobiales bacterium]
MRRGRGFVGVAVAAVVAMAMAACGSSDDDEADATGEGEATEATGSPDEPLEVDVVHETWVDTTRPTPPTAEAPEKPERTIVTRIAHPTSGGPYPLLVMSHGASGHPEEYAETTPMWAADGFVVAQPTFPLTNRDVPNALGNVGDVVEQPGDVSFVIDQVLAANEDPDSPLHGLVDPEAIGVVGHSLGGATTWAVAFDTATRDDRIDSVTIFAGLTMPMRGGELRFDRALPLLVLHGDADDVPVEWDREPWEQAQSPKWFVTLHGATHVPAFTDAESEHDELVTRTILDFWHGTLDGDGEALDRVTEDATDPELATVEER